MSHFIKEPFLKSVHKEDESVRDFFRRRLGDEVCIGCKILCIHVQMVQMILKRIPQSIPVFTRLLAEAE